MRGRSPTGVANLATGAAPRGAVLSGGRGRPDRKRVLHADEEPHLARPPHHRLMKGWNVFELYRRQAEEPHAERDAQDGDEAT